MNPFDDTFECSSGRDAFSSESTEGKKKGEGSENDEKLPPESPMSSENEDDGDEYGNSYILHYWLLSC